MQKSFEAPRPRPNKLVLSISGFAFFLLYAPLLTVVFYSFVLARLSNEPLEFGWRWYREVFQNATLLQSLMLSVVVAFFSSLTASFLGTAAAVALMRGRFIGKRAFEVLSMLPLVMPELVFGLSLLIWFVMLRITLGWISIILAHSTFCISYVMITVMSRLQTLDHRLEEAAEDLGATPGQIFIYITLPLIRPGILAGALMSFTLSFDDFIVSFLTSGAGSDTLPLKLYAMIKLGINPQVYALSTIVLVLTLIPLLIAMRSMGVSFGRGK